MRIFNRQIDDVYYPGVNWWNYKTDIGAIIKISLYWFVVSIYINYLRELHKFSFDCGFFKRSIE